MGLGAGPVLKRKAGGKRSAQRSHGHSRRGGGVRAPMSHRRACGRRLRPGHRGRAAAGSACTACLPTAASPDPTRAPSSASAPDRSSSAAGRAGGKRFIDAEGRDPCRQPDREPPLQVRRWPTCPATFATTARGRPLRLTGAGCCARCSTRATSCATPGRGRYITIYANPGHVYMVVNGRRYDTSARFETGGSRWTSTMRSSSGCWSSGTAAGSSRERAPRRARPAVRARRVPRAA